MEFLVSPMGWFIIVVLVAFGLYAAWGQVQQSKGGNGNQPCPPIPPAGSVPPAFQPKVPPSCEEELARARRKLAELEAENLKLKEHKPAPKPPIPDDIGEGKPKPPPQGSPKQPPVQDTNVPSNRRARFLAAALKVKFDAFRDSNATNKTVQGELWQALRRNEVEFDRVEGNVAKFAAFCEEHGWTRGEGRPDDYELFKDLEKIVKEAGQPRRQEEDELIVGRGFRWLRDPAQAEARKLLNEGAGLAEVAPEVQQFADYLDANKVNRPQSLGRLLPILIDAEKRLRENDAKEAAAAKPVVDPRIEELRKKLGENAKSAYLRTALTTKKDKFLAALKAGKDDTEGLKNAISVYRQLRIEPDLGLIPEEEFIPLLEKAFA